MPINAILMFVEIDSKSQAHARRGASLETFLGYQGYPLACSLCPSPHSPAPWPLPGLQLVIVLAAPDSACRAIPTPVTAEMAQRGPCIPTQGLMAAELMQDGGVTVGVGMLHLS